MDQVLHLDELVRNISYCADLTRQGSASLLALACCCKSLEKPVMDVLWRRQVDLCTILKTLPADSWTITDDVFSLSRNLSRDEWERFREYTARVIILGVPEMHLGFLGYLRAWVSVETIQLLGMESLREGFWPGLCRLTCNIDWELVPFISSFLSPTITDLDLTLPHANNRLLQPTLSLLTHTCRQLRSLRMDVGTFDPLSCREMGRLISTSRHTLHHIDIRSPTPPDIFPAIFDLPQLQDLILQEPHVPYRVPLGILPRLRVISFNGKNGRNLQQFLRGLSMQSLAEVRISLGGTIQFSALLDPLCAATGTMNILCLSHVGTLDRPSITLLCSFTNIAHLKIDCVCPGDRLPRLCNVQLTDESILELGTALPHLHTLSFTPGCRAPCHVTFTSLIYLSRTCGDLEHLSIRVDFASILNGSEQLNRSSPSVRANSARPQRESSGLHSLVVGKSPLPDIPRREWVVALALVSIFPSIVSLRSWCAGEMSDKWKEVAGNIPICQEIFRITHPQAADTAPVP